MGKPDIDDGDFAEGLDGCAEEAKEDTIRGVCARGGAKRGGREDDDVGYDGEEVDRSLAVL